MKNRSSLKQVLVKILAIIVVLLISMNIFRSSNLLQSTDRNTFSFFSMVRYGLIDYPVQTISNLFKDTATMAQLRSENDALRQRVDYDNHWHSLLGELETEVNELKALNDLSSVYSEHTLTSATIKNSSIEAWNQVYTIDKGSDHGIKVGDAIINPNGLVGKVIDVDLDSSVIKDDDLYYGIIFMTFDDGSRETFLETSKGYKKENEALLKVILMGLTDYEEE